MYEIAREALIKAVDQAAKIARFSTKAHEEMIVAVAEIESGTQIARGAFNNGDGVTCPLVLAGFVVLDDDTEGPIYVGITQDQSSIFWRKFDEATRPPTDIDSILENDKAYMETRSVLTVIDEEVDSDGE